MRRKHAFTLIELLTVIVIIGVLSSMLVVVVRAARERTAKTKASAEVRELVRAWKSYWMVYNEWPATLDGENRPMDLPAMRILQGENPQKIVFMNFDIERNDGFRDPWGNYYYCDFSKTVNPGREVYQASVSIPNYRRYHHEYNQDLQ
ncbi:MAG: hypothetical protein A2498_03900 [Lentisphaerae bacterium RIFOXYC12_FULL_60_16]|nr:MAG: hypothetical protein A2498_03900 [Lentisphaerae bacterium RIFOXYC12_FULL_60_16]OGV83707.1 MAG: hypothetical protein A2340_03070 [Lentisphaerae bacterium RIFOXYB12_FULL_60_10]